MNPDDAREDMELNEVWRACRKIQSAIFRYGFDICTEFRQYDLACTGLISKTLFTSVLGKYLKVASLSEHELRNITDYFQIRDGRVAYKQFCQVVCSESHGKNLKRDLATGLEWIDPMHVNVIARPEDRRRLCLILIKIAQVSHLPLMPYFQDYEIVAENAGVVTVAHFSRVLHFMKIPISESDFMLLLKRYMKDAYMVNYVAFLKHIDAVIAYLKERNLLDCEGEIITDFPSRIVDLDLSELPAVDGCKVKYPIFPDYCNNQKQNRDECDLIFCIQNYIYKNRIRCTEFLEGFDRLRCGCITKNQFERGLYTMGLGKFITPREFEMLCNRYLDPIDTDRIRWRIFCDDIDTVFTIKNLDKMPLCVVESPLKHIVELPRPGTTDWETVPESTRDICEDAIRKIQVRIRNRRLHLHPFFRNYDKLNSGHVYCNQANQIMRVNGILLSDAELRAIQQRYGNELGFFYTKFLDDVDPAEYAVPRMLGQKVLEECPLHKKPHEDLESEENIVKILTKAKREAVTRSIPVLDFLQDYDRHREGEITEYDFKRALDSSGIKLSEAEVTTLCKIFRSPRRGCCVLYRDFMKALDEIFIQIESSMGDNVVTAMSLLHLANLDCVDCFLNFDERTTCSQALMKLARKPDEISNLSSVFKDFDREQCGSITQNQFLRGLTVRDMHHMLSSREFDAIVKCFGHQRGLCLEFKYREFLKILDVLFRTGQVKRNY